MTAHLLRVIAESASGTLDPDAQARRTNDGELSAGFQTDLTIHEDAVGGFLAAEQLFDGSILATAAVSAPEAMVQTVGAALDCFGDLPDDERKMLFETFRVWQDNDASVRDAACGHV